MSNTNENNSRSHSNPLSNEKSPYLLMHASNPVFWYPWGEEAFKKAKAENKPIFLSIGYATCHWCHVMERESFCNTAIAEVLNQHFISIKVDREERPDVDKIYMTAVQAMTGSGGWPLSIFLTPDLKPFTGGTYFPPDARHGRPGFKDILEHLAEIWNKDPQAVFESGDQVMTQLNRYLSMSPQKSAIDPVCLENGFKIFLENYEPVHGGFGGAPKFPMPVNINFLLRYFSHSGEKKALEMATHTLRKMAEGGIYDQLGGGFHRYSTDDKWHVPHFEKMLYDNAQLAVNYLEAYQITKDPLFKRIAEETLTYVRRDMTHPDGGFYSAEDADSLSGGASHPTEGAFYIWSKEEILKILGTETGELFCDHFGVEPNGNAEHDPQGELAGKNILSVARNLSEATRESKRKLFDIRAKRPRPLLDDKIIVSWNGLMISAFSKATQILGEQDYALMAEKAARFFEANLYDKNTGQLYRRWREGERKILGTAADYAALIQGLLDLYEATFHSNWLTWALQLTEQMVDYFYDETDGGYFMTQKDHDPYLLTRTKEDRDNVEPSAASIATLNLLRLSQFTDRKEFREKAEKTLSRYNSQMRADPSSFPQMLVALDFALSKPLQIIIAGKREGADSKSLLKTVHGMFLPNKIILLADGADDQKTFEPWLPFIKELKLIEEKSTAYVCFNYACEKPTNDPAMLELLLDPKT